MFVLSGPDARVLRVPPAAGAPASQSVLPNWTGAVSTAQMSTCDCNTDGNDDDTAGENVLEQIDTDEDGENDLNDAENDNDGEADDADSDGSGEDDNGEDGRRLQRQDG